ncbi:hypothetical protein MB818_20545 [Ruegeria sp. 1NDH52C]|uniref:Uncharacterized protein n=1 Tax=Ruegeria alba TaxID=2916756 RepID=A0ABS9P4B1_9RHOB|nr:hypothetical protein [Ruegeria alba]
MAALYMVLAVVIALDFALMGVIDLASLVHALSPVVDVFLYLMAVLDEALSSDAEPIGTITLQVIHLK